MTDPDHEETTGTAEHRKHERKPQPGPIEMTSAEQQISGRVDNVSSGGVMFFSDQSLRIEIEIEEAGKKVRRAGRLVRVQRLNANETAYAVEFDDE